MAAASARRPRLETYRTRASPQIQLKRPSGCLCEIEKNPDAAYPKDWQASAIQPTENGNRTGVLLFAVQMVRGYRLNCDPDARR